jgi:ABC-type phosphate transport system substrate-binding protein
MRNFSKVAVAVAAALGAGSAVAATNPNFTLDLTIAGSSAMRDAVIAEFTNVLCASGTVAGPFVSTQGTPTASGGENPDFRGLTCTLGSAAGSGLTGTVIAMYYRSEGGSIFGVASNPSLAGGSGLSINRINLGAAGGAQPASFAVFETVPQLEADTQTGAVIKDTVDLGVSDVEPAALIGTNYGSEYSFIPFGAPSKTALAAVPTFGGSSIGEVYAPIVSNTGGTAGFASSTGFSTSGLTSQELATIYSGNVTDWSLVPSVAAKGGSGPITVCRRDAGSGTQTVTSTHFLGTNCSTGGVSFVSASSPPGLTVVTNFATGDVLSCVQNHAGSIGLVTLQTAAKYTAAAATQVKVDGTLGTAFTSAQGQYTYYGEAYFIKNTTVTGVKATLINKVVSDMEAVGTLPASASVPNLVGLPSHNATAVIVPTSTTVPVAVGSTGGNVCAPLIDQL